MRRTKRNHQNKRRALAACAILAACALSACGDGKAPSEASTSASVAAPAEGGETVSESISDSAKAMAELSKTGTMKGETYTSANGRLQITLPDGTWAATSDLGTFVSFLSGNDSITISCFSGDMAAPLLEAIPKTQEEYTASLGNEAQLMEVKSFEYQDLAEGTVQATKIVRLINDPSSSVKSEIDYSCYMNGEAFIVSAFLETADEKAIEKAAQAVYSFKVVATGA